MKNYNEMANDVLRRIGEHQTLQIKRRKVMKKVILPICCFCLVALLGTVLWKGNFFGNKELIALEDSTVIGEKDYVEPNENNQSNNVGDVIGMVKYNGANYVQCSTGESAGIPESISIYTPGEYLGEACDFEGTFHLKDTVGGLYNAKEDPNVLMVEIKDGGYTDYVILIKEQAE